jgi:hypothetical protein
VKRWTNILGRGGTTLIAISLALFLVSIIPQIDLITYASSTVVSPGEVYTTGSQGLNPQQGVQLKVTVEGTLKVYLLDVGSEKPDPETDMLFVDAAELQEFLDSSPNPIIWDDDLDDDSFDRYYTPTRVMNATLAFYNPSSETAYVEYNVMLKSSLAPGGKVRTIAYFAAPIGIILAMPWLLNVWKQRKQK